MQPIPPRRALRFLRWFCREDFLEEIEGDLIELFELQYEESPRRANRAFTWQVLRHFRPDFIKAFSSEPLIYPGMLKHNLLITYRSFLRNKSTFLINLIGLSTGLACALFIYLWVYDEVAVDQFHENKDRIYKVMHNLEFEHVLTWEITPVPLGAALVAEMPEVEKAVTVNDFFTLSQKDVILANEDKQIQARGIHASEAFFEVFSYDLLQGDPQTVLGDKKHIMLSESLARRWYGSSGEAMNKVISLTHPDFEAVFQVGGVFRDPPANATEQFDFVISIEVLLQYEPDENVNNFMGSYAETYVLLKEGTDIDPFNEKINNYLREKAPANEFSTLYAQKFSDKYLYGTYENGKSVGGRIGYVKLFSLIGFFILLIACVNFMNLATAKGSAKMKEVGVKKAIGATRNMLIIQFLGESLILSILAFITAILLVSIFMPYFNEITGKQLSPHFQLEHVGFLWGIVLVTGFLAGSYPAFFLSKFKPLAVLKGKLDKQTGEIWIRRGLVIFQFTLTVMFIIGVLVLNQQIRYVQKKSLGYEKDNIVTFRWRGGGDQAFETFMAGLKAIPGVLNATNMQGNIANDIESSRTSGVSWTGAESERSQMFRSPNVSYDFVETLDIEVMEGRSFSREYGLEFGKFLLNETAVKLMGLENPVGARVEIYSEDDQIIGVVKDFHIGSLHNAIEPMILAFRPNGKTIMAKIQGGTEQETLSRLAAYYEEFYPAYSFEYTFLDEDYAGLYTSERKVANLSRYFSGLAIIISCLGLFGLAAFTAERRKKELGVRKVLGASVFQLIRLLSLDFTRMVLLAILIGVPVSYILAQTWLDTFAYNIDLQFWYFGLAAAITLLISWGTVGIQTLKAAQANPVEVLKDE